MIQNTILFSIVFLLFSSCFKGKHVELIVHNAQIHTIDEANHIYDAMAIKNGKIIEVGPERQILNKYSSDQEIDAGGKDIFPGFTDAHGHILSLAQQKLNLDLTNCLSFDELMVRLEKYEQKTHKKFIIGRGWDQSLWNQQTMPNNDKINLLYPQTPICLYRIDGHAVLVNDALLKLAKINEHTKIEGGQIELKNGKCTGLLIDNAILPILKILPKYTTTEIQEAILEIQDELVQYGITGVHEAGINNDDIALFEKLINAKKLKINVYAMLNPSEKNFDFAKKKGIYKNKNLSIRSFKVMGDGALGSHGAYLKKAYSDKINHFGALTTSEDFMNRIASVCELTGYQMNTHCIGDATNSLVFNIYKKLNEINKDHRSRIEHAQIIDPKDITLFAEYGVFPSVQPTHAVSDQRWVEKRIGIERLKGAYAYRSILASYGMLAIGTDFPVENIDPFLTIHAAVQRKNIENTPLNGFLPQESISLDDCIRGMTIWAAYASFQEKQLGSLEKGKDATFVIFENKVESTPNYQPNFAYMTFINGQKIYSVE
ncbi:MAG: amidohydrolase [Flavobacteriia bacterium]|nr:amidohydrolase [Flavobacteriia bacterium]